MTDLEAIYDKNFIEYASYVIKDRAIPHVDDGLKPVQRRILHTLFEMDDGKFHKVANVVGHCMRYHPHGDASIYSALVVLANKEMFIDRQGNFGNIYTGDDAAAARYIECRLLPMAKDTLYNPEITEYAGSYDGRNREPVTFPAKIPVLLAQGAEGIAVGMATRILPHNLVELLKAQIACLRGELSFISVYPDFQTGGLMDVSDYNDGAGKVIVRAKLDTSDPKRIVIRDIPFGATTESLIASIESAARRNKVKISSINDFTAEHVEIELRIARGVHSRDVVDSLYAFTDCETSVSSNLVVINRDNKPQLMTVSEIIRHNSDRLVEVLKAELGIEMDKLKDRLHAKTLEQIFIENRVYKKIESKTTQEQVSQAVVDGLNPFQAQIKREVTGEDVERLLKIPIRRISLYDINKAKKEMSDIKKRMKEIRDALDDIVGHAVGFLEGLIKKYGAMYPRRTEILSIAKADIREVAEKNLSLAYDSKSGYLGYKVEGSEIMKVSEFDRVLVIRGSGEYSVIDVPDKLFVDKSMLFCGFVNKDLGFTLVYREKRSGCAHVKRFLIDKFILNKSYSLVPEGCAPMKLTTDATRRIELVFKPKPRVRILTSYFRIEDYPVRSNKAKGIRLSVREAKSARFIAAGQETAENGEGGEPAADD